MANVIYRRARQALGGEVMIPPSKSFSHRAVICAALAKGSVLHNVGASVDIEATKQAMKELLSGDDVEINCHESGSTLRFLIPLAAALGKTARFVGEGRLPSRPIDIYEGLLEEHGVEVKTSGGLPFEIRGQLKSGVFELRGDVSSQFVTGLMLALPLLEGDSEIKLSSPLESSGYVDITLAVLRDFGVEISETETGWSVKGNQNYAPREYTVEGDWSQAAFFLSIAAFSDEKLKVHGLSEASVQGDKECLDIYRRFGLELSFADGVLVAQNPNAKQEHAGLTAQSIDVRQIPDLVPAVAVCAALAKGETRIYNAGRLRIKESDRLQAVCDAINGVGGKAVIQSDELHITGVERFSGGKVDGCNDHRIVMAMAAAALKAEGNIEVTDAYSINKSYPDFFEDYQKIGGLLDVVDIG